MVHTTAAPPEDRTEPQSDAHRRIAFGAGIDPLVPLGPNWRPAENPRIADAVIIGPEHDREELRYLRQEHPLMPIIAVGGIPGLDELSCPSVDSDELASVLNRAQRIVDRSRELDRNASGDPLDDPHLVFLAFAWTRNGRVRAHISQTYPRGYGYDCEHLLHMDSTARADEVSLLSLLATSGYFTQEQVEVAHPCTSCGSILNLMRDGCLSCGSVDIDDQNIIHHFPCGYQGPESAFTLAGGDYLCPKCHKELRHFGIDYDKPGSMTICRSCGHEGSESQVRGHCLSCSNTFAAADSPRMQIHDYLLTDAGTQALFSGKAHVRNTATLLSESLTLIPLQTMLVMARQMAAIAERHDLDSLLVTLDLGAATRVVDSPAAEMRLFLRIGAELGKIVRPTDTVAYEMSKVYMLLPGSSLADTAAVEARLKGALSGVFEEDLLSSLKFEAVPVGLFMKPKDAGVEE